MKLAIASDLHLEFGDCDISNDQDAEVLILAGDIMLAHVLNAKAAAEKPKSRVGELATRFRAFFNRCSAQFDHVVYVAGNHEFYNGSWLGSLIDLATECARYPNVHFLECNSWTYQDVRFVGGTLWTDMNRQDPVTLHGIASIMTDFDVIRNEQGPYLKLLPQHTVDRFLSTVNYFRTTIDQDSAPCVVVGHHAPSWRSIAARFANDRIMNGAYASDLSEFILDRPQIKLWCHGHTHYDFDYEIGSTRVVCNPRGYIGHEPQAEKFQLKYLEI